jgi:hypothetical protein
MSAGGFVFVSVEGQRRANLSLRPKFTGLRSLQLEARALQSELSGMIHNPLNSVLPALLVPLITIIIKSLKKPAASVSAPAEPAASQSERWGPGPDNA